MSEFEKAYARGMRLATAGHNAYQQQRYADAAKSMRLAIKAYEVALKLVPNDDFTVLIRTLIAGSRMNLGVAQHSNGELTEAIINLEQAENDLEPLWKSVTDDRTRRVLQAHLGPLRMNLGIAQHSNGELTEAITSVRQSENYYETLCNSATDDFTRYGLQAELANTRMNLGVAQQSNGELTDAITKLRQAENDFESLLKSPADEDTRHFLQTSLAATRVNLGVTHRSNDALTEAITSLRQAVNDYEALWKSTKDEGTRRALQAELAQTRMNLGHAQLYNDDLVSATGAFDQSAKHYADLAFTKTGDRYAMYALRHHAKLLEAWFLTWSSAVVLPQTPWPQTPWPWTDERRNVATAKPMSGTLRAAAEVCKQVAGRISTDAARNDYFRPAVLNLLGLMRRVSLELAPNEAGVELIPEAQALLFEAITLADDPQALAHWLMQCRAIRGQILALEQLAQMAPMDASVQDYLAAFARRSAIDREIAGFDGADKLDGPDASRGGMLAAALERIARSRAARLEELRVERIEISNKIHELRNKFIGMGLLPPNTAPNLDVLLMQTHGKAVLVLLRDPNAQASNTVVPLLLHNGTARFLPGAARALTLERAALDLSGSGRGVMRDVGAAQPHDAPARAVLEKQMAAFQLSLPPAMGVLATGLREAGIALGEGAPELLLVPQDDLHKVAWRDVAREHLNVRVTVLPSMPALETRLKQKQAPPRPRWASLAFDAAGTQHARLRWVPIEQALSAHLWADNLRKLDTPEWRADEGQHKVTAVMGAGHGHMEQNIATAGMLIATSASASSGELTGTAGGADQYFTARDLRNIHKADRLWLAVCLLAQTHEKHGEPLGMLAQAMGEHGVEWAAGSLVPVDDMAAALFSLLFQWRLREAYDLADAAGDGCAVDWTVVFDLAKADVRSGQWPAGFAAWLRGELPGVLADAIFGELLSLLQAPSKQRQAFVEWGKLCGKLFPPLTELEHFLNNRAWAMQHLAAATSEISRMVPPVLVKAADTLVSFG